MTERAVVLGGGGVAGIAWAAGLLHGLAEQGVTLGDADLVVGTSAGSVVGAWLATGVSTEEMHARQVDPARQTAELRSPVDVPALWARFAEVLADCPPDQMRSRIGALALETETVPEEARRQVMADRLPVHDWPQGLVVTVVDALTGERRALDAASGYPLVDAVAASCAVPGVWPPMTLSHPTLGDRRYVDGGVHTTLNADLAAGAARVLVLAPGGIAGGGPLGPGWEQDRPLLGDRVVVLEPDEAGVAARGTNSLDPATRRPCAEAGRAQAAGVAEEVRALWS